jgi:hypothetical protein
MRMMMKVTIPNDGGNKAVKDGTIGKLIGQTLEMTKAEASYFFTENGVRTAMFVFDCKDTTTMPIISEPLFNQLNANVQWTPCMNAEELKAGISKIAH